MKLHEAVSHVLRSVHQDLAYADGHAYNFDPGDPRAVDVLLKFLSRELSSDVHLIDPAHTRVSDMSIVRGNNEGVLYASRVLAGEESCSLE